MTSDAGNSRLLGSRAEVRPPALAARATFFADDAFPMEAARYRRRPLRSTTSCRREARPHAASTGQLAAQCRSNLVAYDAVPYHGSVSQPPDRHRMKLVSRRRTV